MKKIVHKAFSYKIIRYMIGGGAAGLVDLGAYVLFTDVFDIYYVWSSGVAFVVSLFFAYVFHAQLTFRSENKKHLHHGAKFFIFQIFGQLMLMLLLWLLVERLGWNDVGVVIVLKILIFGWNYTMNHLFNFK